MYKEDVPVIRKFVEETTFGLDKVFFFVLSSIRTRFYQINEITQDITTKQFESKHVWGNKSKALKDYHKIKPDLKELIEGDLSDTTLSLMQITGLGVAKASFFLQLLGRNTGCLDVHNLQKLELNSRSFRYKDKATVDSYLSVVNEKSSEAWWDEWCTTIYEKYPKQFTTPEEVSKLHVKAIVG